MALGLTWWQLALIVWGACFIIALPLIVGLCRAAHDGDEVLADQERLWVGLGGEAPAGDNWPAVDPELFRRRLDGTVRDLMTNGGRIDAFTPDTWTPRSDVRPPSLDDLGGWLGLVGAPVRTSTHVRSGTVMVMHPDEVERLAGEVLGRPPRLWPKPRDRRPGRLRGWNPDGTYTGDPRTGYRPAWARMATLLDRVR